jgi:hypothetical protein
MLAPGQLEGYREKYGMDQQAPLMTPSNHRRKFCKAITVSRLRPVDAKRRGEFASPHCAGCFPRAAKSSNVIVYFAGSAGRHLVVFNNSARSESSAHRRQMTFSRNVFRLRLQSNCNGLIGYRRPI